MGIMKKRLLEEIESRRRRPKYRDYGRFTCLNCYRLLRSEPKLTTNETVKQYCNCGYMNVFNWDLSGNTIRTIYRTSIIPEQYRKMPNLITD